MRAYGASTRLELAAGGRYDITFTMPAVTPVRLGVPGSVGFAGGNPDLGLLLSSGGKGDVPALANGPE